MPAMRRALVVALIGLTSLVLEARAPRAVGLILTGGTVITVDPARRVLPHGAVAIDGSDIVAVDTAESVAAYAAWLEGMPGLKGILDDAMEKMRALGVVRRAAK